MPLHMLADHGGQCCTGGIATDHEPFGIDTESLCVACDVLGCRDRILDRCRELVLGRKAIVDRDQPAAFRPMTASQRRWRKRPAAG